MKCGSQGEATDCFRRSEEQISPLEDGETQCNRGEGWLKELWGKRQKLVQSDERCLTGWVQGARLTLVTC